MNYLEEAKKFGGTPVPSDTKINFLEEAKKMGGTPVPAQQINYLDAAKQFGGTPVPPSPTTDIAANPFAVEGAAAAPVADKSLSPFEEITKGAKSGVSSLKSVPTATGAFVDVGAALTNLNISSLYDKIDKGEITDPLQIKGSDFEASRARMYLNSKPEMRKVLRDRTTQEISSRKEGLQTATNILQQYQKENLVNKGRTEDLTDVEGVTDFTNWAAYNLGSAGVQLVPTIVAAVTTGGLGVFATGTAMELSGGVQNRLNYILDKTKDIQDPKAKADAVFDYVAKSGDVTLASALASGTVDLVLGPAADLIKRPAAQLVKAQTRKEIAKEIPKAIAKQGGEEFLAGGIQETIQIAAERALGEQTGDFLTKENIKRIVNAAAAESIGGAGYGGGAKAVQAAFAKPGAPGVASTSAEGRAMAGLDALAATEEAAANSATQAATRAKEPAQPLRTLDSLTTQEVDNIQRQLFAVFGRAPTAEELEGAFNDYLAEQNAGRGVEPGADVAGVPSDRGPEATGISDTGLPPTPKDGGLADVGKPAGSVAAGERVQPATLEEATDAYEEAEAARDEAQRKVTQLNNAIEEIGYEGTPEDIAELNKMLTEAEARYEEARQAADAAFQNYEAAQNETPAIAEKSFEELEAEREALKNQVEQIARANVVAAIETGGALDPNIVEDYRQNVFDTIDELGITDPRAKEYADRAFNRLVEESRETAAPKAEEVITEGEPAVEGETFATWQGYPVRLERKPFVDKDGVTKQFVQLTRYEDRKAMGAKYIYVPVDELSNKDESVEALATSYADELFATNPDYDVEEYDAAATKLFDALKEQGVTDKTARNAASKIFSDRLSQLDRGRGESSKPVFALPETAPRVDSIDRFPIGPTSIKPTVVAENKSLYRETNAGGVDDLLRGDLQFGYAPIFVTDNPDIALGQGDNVGATIEFRPNSVSGKINPKPVSGELTGNEYQANVIAPRAIQSITFANQKVANRLSAFSKRALQQRFTKEILPDGKIKFTRKETAGPSLSPDTVGEYKRQPGETIEEYQERLVTGPESKLAPNIVELIRNNDLTGALNAVAAKFSTGSQIRAFYSDLASRLAALNLPTEIRINDARNLTRRAIDSITSPQQVRLFAYLRTAQPAIFDKYFKEYYKDSSLELVYTGLIELNDPKYKKMLGPVENEFNDVLDAYDDYFPGMPQGARGAYYPNFDIINLDETGLNYHTFLHEAVHAATETLLRTPASQRTPEQNAAIEELQKLYDLAKNNIKVKEYGLTNLSEFIAEVYTNYSFRNLLKRIPYAPARTNILTRFIQSIMKLVGMDNVAGRAMVEAEKLFSAERPLQTISAGPRFMTAKRQRKPRGPISTPDTYRTATDQQNMFLQTIKDAYDGRMEWKDAIKILGPALWDSKNTILRGTTLPVLNLTHLEDLTRTKFTQLTGALKIIRDMVAYRAKKMNAAGEILTEWTNLQKKNFAQSQLMGRIMLEATIRGRDPDAGVPSGTAPDALDKAWKTLKPEYKEIYRKVRNFYSDSVNQMVQEMKRRAAAITDPVAQAEMLKKIDDQFGPNNLVKPYFPLRRFGQYWFQVGSGNFKEFYEFESPVSRDIAMRRRMRELSRGNAQQKKLAETIAKGNGISELYGRNIGTTQVLKDVQELVDGVSASDVTDLKDQLQDSLNQLIYLLLPQQSMRKMFINRKAIQGASSDMLRVFATTAVHSAYQQSRFMFAEKFLQNLNNARSEIDDAQKVGMLDTDTAAAYKDFILEVEKRVPTVMSNEDTSFTAQIAGKASELTFYYMLSAPFTAMLNTIGAVQLAMPYIGGSYGYAKANARLLKNMGRYLSTSPTRTFTPLVKGNVSQVNFPSIVESAKLPPLLRRAADRFLDDGVVDISLTNDIFELGDRPSQLYTGIGATVKKVMSGLFHQSERMNREILLLTTFELAYEKAVKDYQRQPGMEGLRGVYLRDAQGNKIKNTPDQAFELAIEEATRVAALTLGDYSRQMKGRIFSNPIANLLLKFKQYPILALFAVYRNLQMGYIEPFKKAELDQYRTLLEKELANDPNKDQVIEQRMEEVEAQRKALSKEARRRLAGILGVSMILGGQTAMPYFTLVIGTLAKMFAGEDEDDYFDWENWFYNYMETEFGGYLGAMLANAGVKPETAGKAGRTTAEIISRGVPSAMGAAIADRVSLDPKALLWRDGRFSPDARENFIESIIANAGPVVGLGLNFTDAYQLAKDGQYARAAEKALPAIVAKPLSAIRMKEEGAKTKGGDVLVDDFTTTELAMQAIGLQPERLAQKQKAASAMKLKEQKIKAERTSIMDRLWMERDNPDAFEAQIERAAKFSEKHPALAITPKRIRESFEKRAKAAAEAEAFGARIDKKLRGELGEMGEFAADED